MDINELRDDNVRLRKALHLAQLSNGGLMARVKALEHRSKQRMKRINDLKRKYQQVKKDLATAIKVVNDQIQVIHGKTTVHLHSEQGSSRSNVAGAEETVADQSGMQLDT